MSEIQKYIKELRRSRGLTQEDMAEKIEVSQSCYCQIEVGRREPSLSMLKRIAECLDVPIVELFGYKSDAELPDPALVTIYSELNDTGRKKLIEYGKDLLQISQYKSK